MNQGMIWVALALLAAGLCWVVYKARQKVLAERAEVERIRKGRLQDDISKLTAAGITPAQLAAGVGNAMQGISTSLRGFIASAGEATASMVALGIEMKRLKVKASWSVKAGLNWHDVWVGVYWKAISYTGFDNMPEENELDVFTVYICPVPCCVITVRRATTFQLVPIADDRVDPVCIACGLALSQHPVQNCNNLASGERTCEGNFKKG